VSWGARIVAGLIRVYQLVLSPWVTQSCKYYPSCSQYALDAVVAHGVLRGTGLAIWRLLRCNPWSRGGVDHVPPSRRARLRSPVVPGADESSLADEPTTEAPPAGDDRCTRAAPHALDDRHRQSVRPTADLART
jgi:putative membrane protein insertion efficiency factor